MHSIKNILLLSFLRISKRVFTTMLFSKVGRDSAVIGDNYSAANTRIIFRFFPTRFLTTITSSGLQEIMAFELS